MIRISLARLLLLGLIATLPILGIFLSVRSLRGRYVASTPVNNNHSEVDCPADFDPRLADELRNRYDAARIFAWGGAKDDGCVAWVDTKGHLQNGCFTKTDDRYEITSQSRDLRFMTVQTDQGSYAEYLQDTELPVRADLMEYAGFRATVVLLWRARMRCFSGDPDDKGEETWPGLRVVISRGSTIVSNTTIDFDYEYPSEVLIDDVNRDGIKDYVFSAGFQSSSLRIWTLTNSGIFQPMAFIEKGSNEREDFLEDRSVSLEKDKNLSYSIDVSGPSGRRIGDYEHHLFHWNPSEDAFVETKWFFESRDQNEVMSRPRRVAKQRL